MSSIPQFSQAIDGGTQDVYRFANGYGASVMRSNSSLGGRDGLYELAAMRLTGPGNFDWELICRTAIPTSFVGYLTVQAVQDLLAQIQAFEALS